MLNLSKDQKINMIHSVESEKILRDNILVPIFRNNENFYDVIVTHGANERGKDLILIQKSPFSENELEYTAVIVKNEDITNATSGKNKETAANIALQLSLTISSGYDCIIKKNHVKFNKILLLTSGKISQTAQTDLINFAQQFHFHNIIFKQGKDLVEWIDKYLPDFYQYNDGTLAYYMNALKSQCERVQELKNIGIYKGEIKRLIDVFITPYLYRVIKVKTSNDAHRTEALYEKLERILFQKDNILIIGEAGSGKSTLIRAQIQHLISLNTRGKKPLIPILLRAALIDHTNADNLHGYINTYIRETYGMEDFNIFLSSTKADIFLFVDGLDEVADMDDRKYLLEKVCSYTKNNQNVKAIITSRTITELDLINIPHLNKWDLMPFNDKQIKNFIQKWFSLTAEEDKAHPLLNALQDHDLLEKLPNTPLVLTFLAILFESDNFTEVPANLSELYKMFVELMLGKWNLDRRIETMYDANIKEITLTEMARVLHENNKYSMTLDHFIKLVDDISEKLGKGINWSNLLKELIEQTCLIGYNEKEELEFRHLSFQEYMLAKQYVKKGINPFNHQMFIDSWWNNVIYYYCGIRRDNEVLLKDISQNMIELELEVLSCVKGILVFGYLIQSSYETHANIRRELIVEQALNYGKKMIELKKKIETDEIKTEMPIGLLMISCFHMFKLYYKSRFLKDLYIDIFSNLLKEKPTTFEEKFRLLLIAAVLAEVDKADYLLDIYHDITDEPLLNLIMDFEFHYHLEEKNYAREISEVKKITRKLRRQMSKGRQLYKSLLTK